MRPHLTSKSEVANNPKETNNNNQKQKTFNYVWKSNEVTYVTVTN